MRNSFFMIGRGWAIALGGFILLNLAGELRRVGFDANPWWIDLRGLPPALVALLLLAASAVLLGFGLKPLMTPIRRRISVAVLAGILFVTGINALTFWSLLARDRIASSLPVPLSLLIFGVLLCILISMLQQQSGPRRRGFRSSVGDRLILSASIAFACGAFPLAQIFFFGSTDYARRADVAIVLGARAYADGRPSAPLADRVRTACDLFHRGQVRWLLMTGGPGDGDIYECEAMQRFAVSLGVPADRILLDREGVSTEASVTSTLRLLDAHGLNRALVVSHGYHLPRIKLAYQRAGMEVFTVPARERYGLRAKPYFLAREVAAIWWYYLSPLWS